MAAKIVAILGGVTILGPSKGAFSLNANGKKGIVSFFTQANLSDNHESR